MDLSRQRGGSLGSLLLVGVFALLLVFATLGGLNRPFHTRGEAREALAAQSILAGDSWILPRIYDGRLPSKPPFTHWMMVLSTQLFGDDVMSEAAARFPSALASLLFVLFFFIWVQGYFNRSTALIVSLILVTSIEWSRSATVSRVDMVFSVAVAAAVCAIINFVMGRGRYSKVLLFLALTIGVLSKGPAAWVIVGLFALTASLVERSWRPVISCLEPGIASVIVPAAWYLWAAQIGGDEFIAKVMEENFKRFAGTMHDPPHVHGPLYLIGTLLLGTLPWTTLLIQRAKWLTLSFAEDRQQRGVVKYSLIFCLLVLLFFSIPSSKRGVYLLPMYPFLALTLGAALSTQQLARPPALKIISGLISILLTALFVKLPVYFNFHGASLIRYILFELTFIEHLMLVAMAGAFLSNVLRSNGIIGFSFCFLALLCFVNVSLMPVVANYLTPRGFSERIRQLGIPANGIQSYQRDAYGVAYYVGHDVSDFKECGVDIGYIIPLKLLQEFESRCGGLREVFRSERGVIKLEDIWIYGMLNKEGV